MAYDVDEELEASTNRVMLYGVVLLFAMAAVFPLYRFTEPSNRTEAREEHLSSLAESGEGLWSLNCSSCHGLNGEGGIGPALNSKQFLQAATDEQIQTFVAVGLPGTQMSAYSQDFAGPFTSEQIRAVTVYMRSWEEDAPDREDWRDPQADLDGQ
ncbi:MAG: cytochrome c [Acidimicrobiia bacterium]|nr:cytochrome c [Acidimicrobiia bacterium]